MLKTQDTVQPVSRQEPTIGTAPVQPSKAKVLYIVQLPPPLHGVSAMNKIVVNSKVVNTNLSTSVIPLSFSDDLDQLQKFTFSKLLQSIKYGFLIFKIMVQFKPTLVYFTLTPTTMAFYRDAFFVMILKLFPTKIVFHLHGKGIRKTVSGRPIIKRIYAFVFKNTHVICLSKTLTADIEKIYGPKPYVVPNGIQARSVTNQEQEQDSDGIPQLLYLSNYTETKGALILLRALAILKRRGYRFYARFVGAPFDLSIELLNSVIVENELTGFAEIVGPLYGEDKEKAFRQADIFVHPTYNDAFPLVNLEAMQFSLPIVTTLEGGNPDIVIDNETGFLVETHNPPMLADKIAVLLESAELRTKMGKKGYERFTCHFTLDHFERTLKDTFDSILMAG